MNYFDQEAPDVDDDGNPLTVNAAIRMYHQGDSKNVYFAG